MTRAITKPSSLGEHYPQCSMTPITDKTGKKNILPMEFYNTSHCIIYNDHRLEYDKHIIYWSFETELITIFTIITTYTHIHICTFSQPTNKRI